MATTTAFGSLSVPAPDDTMEMSSPAVRNLDDDIDIDFEDYQGGVQLIDDERMLEDSEPTRPTTATDDMMEDDMLPGEEAHVDEEIMRDDVPEAQDAQQQEDEELIDYGEDEFQEPVVDDTVIPAVEQSADVEYAGFTPLDSGIPTAVDSTSVEAPGPTFLEEAQTEVEHNEEPAQIIEDFLATEQHLADGTEHEDGHALFEEAENHEDTEHTENESLTNQPADGADLLNFRPPLNTATSTSADTPGTPTDTGLHPMTIRYGDLLLPLFKSQRQPDGLLKDDNLANLSLAELITNCRQRLALKIGEDVSEDQELVLGFEHMGLILVEVRGFAIHKSRYALIFAQDCRAAFESSLHDVLEVYLQLHQNDGSEEIPPLSLSLTMQLKFQSSFAVLKQAAAGGQGMSSFNFLHTAAREPEDFYQDEYDDEGISAPPGEHDTEDGFEGHGYGDAAYVDHGEEAPPDAEHQHQDYYEHAGEQGEEGHEDYDQEGEFREQFGDDEFYIPEQDEAAARLDELEAGESYTEEALANTLEDPGLAADGKNAGEQKAASTASSTTVQGDLTNNSAGEYDDELIDWDDDSLTTTHSEHDADTHQDFSTFLTEYEEDDAKIGLPGDNAEETHGNSGLEEKDALGQSIDTHLGSEDFLNSPTGQKYGDEAPEGEQNYEGEYGAGDQAEHEELTFDQADTYDQQHDEYHPDYQPGEEDEQYHTAQDFLNTQQYEDGAGHDAYEEDGEGLDDTVETVIHHETAQYEEYDEQEDFGDEIGFDQDDESEVQHNAAAATSGSPSGKRSFDEIEDFEDEDREVKKARPS